MSRKFLFFSIILLITGILSFSAVVELELLTHPQEADVYVDQVWRGNSPETLSLSPGKHEIELKKSGYVPMSMEMDIRIPSVLEYNLFPEKVVADQFPIVIYLTNYQQSGSRKILFRENEDLLINGLKKRFEDMGFMISVEKPQDEFDLIMDTGSIYEMLSERHPQAKMFMLVNALWSYTSFREKKVTRLEVQTRIYDPNTSIALGTYQDTSEGIGMMGSEIVVLQTVEKATQNFLDNIGNYLVERVDTEEKRPILAAKEKYNDENLYVVKSDSSINELKLYNDTGALIDYKSSGIESVPLNIVFLIDRSGSNENELPKIKEQIESILTKLPQKAEWALVGFDDQIEIIQNFTTDFNRWTFAKDKIVSTGMTRLYDAIYNTATILLRREGINIVILLSDGIDSDYYDTGFGSIKTEEEALTAIEKSGMILYPIGISDKNYETLLKQLAYLSTTDYYDLNKVSIDSVSESIIKDISTNLGIIETSSKETPVFSINGYKYIKEENSRFLNQDLSITSLKTGEVTFTTPESDDSEPVEIIINPASTPEESKAIEQLSSKKEESNLTGEEPEKKIESTTTKESSLSLKESPVEGQDIKVVPEEQSDEETVIVEEIPIQPESSDTTTEELTTEKTEPEATTINSVEVPSEKIVQEIPEGSEEKTIEETKKAEETEPAVQEKNTTEFETVQEAEASVFEENVLEINSDFNEVLNLREVKVFDLDDNGNLAWKQGDILYFFVHEQNRLAGISISGELKTISFDFPQISLIVDQELKVIEIREDKIVELSSKALSAPVSFIKLLREKYISIGYENGNLEIFDIQGNLQNEWKLTSGVINNLVYDDYGRIIFSSTTGRAGWLTDINDSLTEIKIDKPIVGLCPFDVDESRFLIVDASGAVYFQRFENVKPTTRNLNRGIVLKANCSEASNLLFANHWDKSLRGYRIFDLKETFTVKSKKGIEMFDVDKYGEILAIQSVDDELSLFGKNIDLPSNLEKIYLIVEEKEVEVPEIEDEVIPSEVTPPESTPSDEVISTDNTVKEPPVQEEPVRIETEHTAMDLSTANNSETKDSSELESTDNSSKEEEVAIVINGNVVQGNIDEKPDTPIPASKTSERVLTAEEKQGLTAVYGGWKMAIAYKDFGYIIAGDSEMRIVNPLLQTIKTIPYSKAELKDMDISKYNILSMLFSDKIEIWDVDNLFTSKDTSHINSYKFPITNGKNIRFSRNGEFLILLRDNGECKIMSLDFTSGKNIFNENVITAIEADLSEGTAFLFGDAKGNIGTITINGIQKKQKVSENRISHVFSYRNNIYWVDSQSNVGILGKSSKNLTSEKINAVYPADIDKDWILFGTDKGTLLITNNELKEVGKASVQNSVFSLRGYKESMISIDEKLNLESWNLIAGSVLSDKPNFMDPYSLFTSDNQLAIITDKKELYTYKPNTDTLKKTKFVNNNFEINEILKDPLIIHSEGKKYYPFINGQLYEKSIEVYKEGNVNSSEKYFMYWENDYLSVYDVENSEMVRTLKFGEENKVHYAAMRNDRLFFFFNQSMGITNPYNPGQVIVIDLAEEGIGEIVSVFLINGSKLGILDRNGHLVYYLLIEDRLTLPIELDSEIEEAYFVPSQMKLIARSGNQIITYNALDNDIQNYIFTNTVKDFTWTSEGIYILTTDGTIWFKENY
ncbi:MAG TPA: VWA domain-containing protein [Thermotogota bacterium]|nr:VWA domain-containing protein [Thermotogota bacterium]HPJ87695.1 VWA domain-containing protein [Thermotogota bacterium]